MIKFTSQNSFTSSQPPVDNIKEVHGLDACMVHKTTVEFIQQRSRPAVTVCYHLNYLHACFFNIYVCVCIHACICKIYE